MMSRKIACAIAALLAVGIAASACSEPEQDVPTEPSYYTTAQEQLDYQYELDRSEDRVAGNFPSYDTADGRIYLAVSKDGWTGGCFRSCAVAVKNDDGWEVKLPVGFTYALNGSNAGMTRHVEEYNAEQITSITYWDPEAHELRTTTAEDGGSVQAPEVLRSRQVKDLEVGQYGFIAMHDVIEVANGKVEVVSFGEMSLEPGDYSFETDYDLVIPVTRREDGTLILCMNRPPVFYLPDTELEEDGIDAEIENC
jgi:hypothetical protein